MKIQSCQKCPKRDECVKLCPRAERYVAQDDDPEAWGKITPSENIEDFDRVLPKGLSTCEAILQNYFIDRMNVTDIADKYDKSRQYVHRTIKKYSTIIIKNIKKSVYNPTSHKGLLVPSPSGGRLKGARGNTERSTDKKQPNINH